MTTRWIWVGALLLALSACASPARVERMVVTAAPEASAVNPALVEAVCVEKVTGGQKTNPLWTSEVDDAGFRGALEASLRNTRLLAESEAGCRYGLEAHLLGLAQPAFGFDITVTSHVNYKLLERASGEPYYQTTVTAPYEASVSDAFIGVERLRKANEGSIRTNIRLFIDELIAHKPA